MNEQDFRTRLDAELSQIVWTDRDRRRVLARSPKGGKIMKRKVLISLMFAAALLLMALTAYAASLVFSPRVDIARVADRALAEQYGITDEMQVYFTRAVAENADGTATVTYTGNWDMNYVLGKYTVTVKGKEAKAAWSHDGEDTSGGLEAEAWGAEQLSEVLRLYKETHDMKAYYDQAAAIALRRGQAVENQASAPQEEITEETFNQRQDALRAKCRLSEAELLAIAREAVQSAYGLNAAQMEKLAHNPGLSSYQEKEGQIYYEACLVLIQSPSEDPNVYPDYVKMDGEYGVVINADTGVVEDIFYDAALAGNG